MASRTTRAEKVEYTLLENGLDFVQHGLDEIANVSEPSELKYAVLHFGGGIELVLKERLRREDWRLIFSNPLHADKQKYSTGNFISVNLHQCLDRLEQVGVQISVDARRKVQSFYDRRNRIQHFRFSDTREAIESAAAEVVFACEPSTGGHPSTRTAIATQTIISGIDCLRGLRAALPPLLATIASIICRRQSG